jgi:Protein of unknown function (DUF4232)
MRILKITAMAACVLAGGITLAGCQSDGGSGGSGSGVGGSRSSTAQGAGTSGAGSAGTANAQGTSSSAATTSGSGGSGGNGGGSDSDSGYGICQAGGLKISLDGQNTVSSQVIEWVQLANTASTPCTMDGFAGVNLVGSASGQSDYTWPLTRDSESYSQIVLKPGESAYFGIKYLPWASGDGAEIKVANIVLTPANTTTSITLPWSASVQLQDGATSPGTYLTPIAPGTNS